MIVNKTVTLFKALVISTVLIFGAVETFADYKIEKDMVDLLELTNCKKDITTLDELVSETQHKFFITNKKDNIRNYEIFVDKIRDKAKKLGYIDQIKPTHKQYDAVLVLGCKYPCAKQRMETLKKVIDSGVVVKDIFLLGSDRPLDSGEKEHIKISFDDKNETTLLRQLFNNKKIITKKNYLTTNLCEVFSRCEITGKRCITDDTIIELLKEYKVKFDKYKRILVISSQPYVKYQNKVVKYFLRNNSLNIEVETIGTKANNLSADVILNSIAKDLYMTKKLNG